MRHHYSVRRGAFKVLLYQSQPAQQTDTTRRPKNIPDRLALGKANVVVRCCCAPSGGEKGNKKRSQSSSCLSLLCAAILFPFRLDAGCLCVFYPLGVERERKRLLKLDSFFDAIDRIRPRLWGRRPLYNSFSLFSLCVMAENGM